MEKIIYEYHVQELSLKWTKSELSGVLRARANEGWQYKELIMESIIIFERIKK